VPGIACKTHTAIGISGNDQGGDGIVIRYQYQLLRYQPDALSGEFVLMGYVLWCPSQQVFSHYLTPHFERRAENFFAATPAYFKQTLRQGLKSLDTLLFDFQVPTDVSQLSLENMTAQLLPANENALCFGPQKEALAVDLDQAKAFLRQRIEKYILL
jgi:hypothetical protein